MYGSSLHESSLYQGPYPGAVNGRDAPPGPIQPVALGLTAQQGGRRGSRKANRKASRKNRKNNRKASRKNRKNNRKANRKN